MSEPYNYDFPELAHPPDETWRATLEAQRGLSQEDSFVVVMNIHASVLWNVERVRNSASRVPLTEVDEAFVRAHAAPHLEEAVGSEAYGAVIRRITEVLRGEMDPPDLSSVG